MDGWMIDDEVVRMREWGSDRCYPLPSPERIAEASHGERAVLIGSAEGCAVRPSDPTGRMSRQHAQVLREHGRWLVRDLDSKNGTRLDGVRRTKMLIEPGSEIGLGGVTLIAESRRLIALRGYLARVLGWSDARSEAVDLALRAVRMAATRRIALTLCGEGDLVPIAHGLHRFALGAADGERPFVMCDPGRRAGRGRLAGPRPASDIDCYASGMEGLAAAAGGSMCVLLKRLPRDFAEITAALCHPSTRVQLIACGVQPSDRKDLVSAPIDIPPLETRGDEIDRIVDEYARDAALVLGVSTRFTSVDRDWVLAHCSESLPEIEKGALRLVALREAGNVARAASLLGMAHASLGEWIGRRRLPWAPRASESVAFATPSTVL